MANYLLAEETNVASVKTEVTPSPNPADAPSYRRESASDIFDILNCSNGRTHSNTGGNIIPTVCF